MSHRWGLVLGGQALAMSVSGTGVFTTYLINENVNVPTFQCFIVYVALASVYLPMHIYHVRVHNGGNTFSIWKYLVLALCDAEANFLVVKAYAYTDLPSIQLLDCLTIPCVMILGRIVFRTKFTFRRTCGVILCLLGIGVLVFTDVTKNSEGQSGSSPVVGDLYCIGGAILYAFSNIGCEALLKVPSVHQGEEECDVPQDTSDTEDEAGYKTQISIQVNEEHKTTPFWLRVEYVAYLSFWGTLISGVQVCIVELQVLESTTFTPAACGYLVGFIAVMVVIYTFVPLFLASSSSTFFNLSMLCSDGYSLLFSVCFFRYTISVGFVIAYVLIICGLATYHKLVPAGTKLNCLQSSTSNGE